MDFDAYNGIRIVFGAIAVLFAVVGIAFWLIASMQKKWKAVFGPETASRDDAVKELFSRLVRLEEKTASLEPKTKILEDISDVSIQKVGFRRYNPFAETGGDQSFTLSLLDRENTGVVITSLYLREGQRIYGKKIEKGEAKHSLSEEERGVLEDAIKK